MTVAWLSGADLDSAKSMKSHSLEWLAESDKRIADKNPLQTWGHEYYLRLSDAEHAATAVWLIDEDADAALKLFRIAGESVEAGLQLRGKPEPMVMRIVGDKVVRESASGDFSTEDAKVTPRALQLSFRMLVQQLSGEVVNTPTGKGIAFMGFGGDASMTGSDHLAAGMQCSLIANDVDMARRIAEWAVDRNEFPRLADALACCVKGLRDILIGDEASAREVLAKAADTKKEPPLYPSQARAYVTLLEGNPASVTDAFRAYLSEFRKRVKHGYLKYWSPEGGTQESRLIPTEFLLSIPGLAFCNLAASRGVGLEFDEPFLPRQLLNG